MNKLRLILIIFIPFTEINAQFFNRDYLIHQDEITKRCHYIHPGWDCTWRRVNEECYKQILQIEGLNVFEFFNLEDTYDTELKKSVFMESREYKDLLDSLKQMKVKLSSIFYCIDINGNKNSKGNNLLSGYDLNTKSFNIDLDRYLYDINEFSWYCEILDFGILGINSRQLKIPITIEDKKLALEMENNKSNMIVFFIFKINGLSDNESTPKIGIDTLRILLCNGQNNQIYYDSIYTPISYIILTGNNMDTKRINPGGHVIASFVIKNDKRITTNNNLVINSDLNLIYNLKIIGSKGINNDFFRKIDVEFFVKKNLPPNSKIPINIQLKTKSIFTLLQSFLIPINSY